MQHEVQDEEPGQRNATPAAQRLEQDGPGQQNSGEPAVQRGELEQRNVVQAAIQDEEQDRAPE